MDLSNKAVAPFLKWAGGKRQLMHEIYPRIPSFKGRYVEPFMGGAAVFFRVAPQNSWLNDINEELVNCFCVALKEWPAVNAMIEGDEIVYNDNCHISIAVSTPKGLVVPVIRKADELGFDDIENEVIRLATKARDGKLSIDEMQGGTFTITNGGIFGSMLSTPIINAPQSAILGMHNIVKRGVVVNDELVIKPMMYLALSYDHRIIDGKESVSFLKMVKENLEDPRRLFLDI